MMISYSTSKTTAREGHRSRTWASACATMLFILTGSVVAAHAAAPTITSLSVPSGPVGSSVTITGTNFGTPRGASIVTINGAPVTAYTTWGVSSIKVQVPVAAITSGKVVVTVAGVNSNGVAFTVTPSITSLSLTTGPVQVGMDIAGYTFGNTQGASAVKIGNTPLTVLAGGWSSTKIAVQVPVGAVTGSVIVTVAANASNGQTFTVKTFGCP